MQHEAQALLLFVRQRFVPAPGGVIVVGPCIGDRARFRIEGEAAVGPFFQMEWQDPHPRQGKAAAQLAYVVGDDAQVFGDEPHRSQCLIDPAQDVFSRCRFPLPFFGRLCPGRNGPVGRKSAEMVDPHFIDEGKGVAEALDPPVVSVFGHGFIIIEGVAPELSFGTEVIGRHTGHALGMSCLIEVEQVLMGPAVGTVMGDEHGDVPQDRDAVVMGIGAYILPLAVYDVLEEAVVIDGTGQFFSVAGTGCPFMAGDVSGPLGPRPAFEKVADGTEQGVVIEPVLVFAAEPVEGLPGNDQTRVMGHIPQGPLLALPGFVPR